MSLHWYVLYTKPKQERHVSEYLSARGFETYLPEVPVISRTGKPAGMVAFFPCYVFAKFDPLEQGALQVQWTPGLRRIVSFGGKLAQVDPWFIQRLRERLDSKESEALARGRLKPGDRVRVVEGVFRDFEAVFDAELSGRERVRILLDVLGRTIRVEIERGKIVKR